MVDSNTWFNVPGNTGYREDLPLDNIVMSAIVGLGPAKPKPTPTPIPVNSDLTVETDPGNISVLVVPSSGTSGVSTDTDPDSTPVLVLSNTYTNARVETDPDGATVLVGAF